MDIKTHSCAQKGKSLSESIKFPTLLEAIERVVELSKDSKMSNDFLQNALLEIGLIADSYGITEQQGGAVLHLHGARTA